MTDIYDPFGFRESDKRNERWRLEASKMFVPGIDPADLKKGDRITISPNLRYEDNSYTSVIHTVLGVNQQHVMTMPDRHWSDKAVLLSIHQHHFYSAKGLEE